MSFEKIKLLSLEKDDITKQFFTVLSIELGNTTIKSIITTSNVKNNKTYQLIKLVKLTRDIRKPYDDETIFGHTIWDKALSKEAICEEITSLIVESLNELNLKVSDLDFVVRSTGVVAIYSDEEINHIIKALSEGCLNAGIKPSQMTAPFTLNNIPEHIRPYSFFNNIPFDGSVVGVSTQQLNGTSANEMESELVTAGIKLASKSSSIDYRNPLISIDMGTTLAGQIIDNSQPYANISCNYLGLAGGIMDIILRKTNIVSNLESTIDMSFNSNYDNLKINSIHKTIKLLHEFIEIIEIPPNVSEFGKVSISQKNRIRSNIKLIGSQISDEEKLIQSFKENCIGREYDISIYIDCFYAYYIKRLIDKSFELNLIKDNYSLGITGRSGTTGLKPKFIEYYLKDTFDDVLFVEDGLALGAMMMSRCMNSLGTPLNPIGGIKKGLCIMQKRIKN